MLVNVQVGNLSPSNAYVWYWLLLPQWSREGSLECQCHLELLCEVYALSKLQVGCYYATAMMSSVSFWAHHCVA